MKKAFLWLIIVSMIAVFSLAGCKAEEAVEEQPEEETAEEAAAEEPAVEEVTGEPEEALDESEEEDIVEAEDQSIEVNKGLFSVEITLPASFFEGQDINDIKSGVEDDDIKIILNEDGSVTYKMSKSKHKEFMAEIYNDQVEYIEEIKNSGDYKSIKDITFSKTFSELTLLVDQEAFENSFDGFVALGLGVTSLYYQLFNGVSSEDYKVTIYFKNVETGEIFDDVVYPDALEE